MRVIAGSQKGRRLKTPGNLEIRPTSDKVKGALFNTIGSAIYGASFLDLCAGSGAISIEALSRGATSAVIIEQDRKSVELIKSNLQLCRFLEKEELEIKLITSDALSIISKLHSQKSKFDIIFADPPYNLDIFDSLFLKLQEFPILNPEGQVIVEHISKKKMADKFGNFEMFKSARYGDTTLSYYSIHAPPRAHCEL